MLAWVVIFHSEHRRWDRRHSRQASPFPMLLPNSFPLNSLAGPHLLNPVPSILYENMGGGGATSPFQLLTSKPLTSQNCSKFFSCNTYGFPRKCCKQKTYGLAKPFRCNTYKKQEGTSVHSESSVTSALSPSSHFLSTFNFRLSTSSAPILNGSLATDHTPRFPARCMLWVAV